VLSEHLIYSATIAILFGMVYRARTGREYSWIIILSAFAPDVDIFASSLLKRAGITLLINGSPIVHGDFHDLTVLVLYALAISFLLYPLGIAFMDSFIFAAVGYGAHFFEDALVFSEGYRFLWPLSSKIIGWGILVGPVGYKANIYGIADTRVLGYGLIFLAASIIIRTIYERKNWADEMIDVANPYRSGNNLKY
jgi:hypothetical protein